MINQRLRGHIALGLNGRLAEPIGDSLGTRL
jgi:hypothetical protein